MLSRTSNQFGPISTSGKARAAYRYYRWSITKIRDYTQDLPNWPIGLVQAAEIQLFFAGTSIGITGATCTNPGGNNPTGEEPDKANDGTVTTKWLDRSGNGIVGGVDTGSTASRKLVIDFGVGTRKVIDAFRFATANDVDGRDPVQWTLEGSNDNSNWTMLHMQSTDASVTTSRQTFTQLFYLQV
jgi:hypothetical protein